MKRNLCDGAGRGVAGRRQLAAAEARTRARLSSAERSRLAAHLAMTLNSLLLAAVLLPGATTLRCAAPTTLPGRPGSAVAGVSRRAAVETAAAFALTLSPLTSSAALAGPPTKAKRELQPELVQLLWVQEATGQETRLIESGKYKTLQRLNVKRAVGMLLDNYDLNGRIVAASAYAPSGQQQRAINYGSTAIEDLTQILEYFPDKLKANTLTPEQSRFVLAALRDASENIDRFMALMPAEVVERARAQVAEENRMNVEEMPKDVEILNPPTVGAVAEAASG